MRHLFIVLALASPLVQAAPPAPAAPPDSKTWLESEGLEAAATKEFQEFEAIVARVKGAKDAASAQERVLVFAKGKLAWQSGPKDLVGSGQQVTTRQQGNVAVRQISSCPVCHGGGKAIGQACPVCAGRGEVEKTESLTVVIPVGVENGTALCVAGRGMARPEPGGIPGDLYVVVHARPDPRFQRDGADLWRQETLPLTDAVLGTRLEISTLEGSKAQVEIPAGIQPETVLRLRDKGLPRFGGKGKGDMYLRIGIRIPEKLSSEERELYERLRTLSGKTKRHFWE